jgi:hypothetical protein
MHAALEEAYGVFRSLGATLEEVRIRPAADYYAVPKSHANPIIAKDLDGRASGKSPTISRQVARNTSSGASSFRSCRVAPDQPEVRLVRIGKLGATPSCSGAGNAR